METEVNMRTVRDFIERAMNRGDLTAIDEYLSDSGADHQEPPGTDYKKHLTEVVVGLRTAFPDLHFEIHQMMAEGDTVAFRATMTGTHRGPLRLGAGPLIPPTGKAVNVAHMYFIRCEDGKSVDLWHVWDNLGMLRQLGVMGPPPPQVGEMRPERTPAQVG